MKLCSVYPWSSPRKIKLFAPIRDSVPKYPFIIQFKDSLIQWKASTSCITQLADNFTFFRLTPLLTTNFSIIMQMIDINSLAVRISLDLNEVVKFLIQLVFPFVDLKDDYSLVELADENESSSHSWCFNKREPTDNQIWFSHWWLGMMMIYGNDTDWWENHIMGRWYFNPICTFDVPFTPAFLYQFIRTAIATLSFCLWLLFCIV